MGGHAVRVFFCVSRCRCIHVDVNVPASIVVLLEYCVSCRCVVLTGRVMCVFVSTAGNSSRTSL